MNFENVHKISKEAVLLLMKAVFLFALPLHAQDVWSLEMNGTMQTPMGTAHERMMFEFGFCKPKIQAHAIRHEDLRNFAQAGEATLLSPLLRDVEETLYAQADGGIAHFREAWSGGTIQVVIHDTKSNTKPSAPIKASSGEHKFDMPLKDGSSLDWDGGHALPPGFSALYHYKLRLVSRPQDDIPKTSVKMTDSEKAELNKALQDAKNMLPKSRKAIENFLAAPDGPFSKQVVTVLTKHFAWKPEDDLQDALPRKILTQIDKLTAALASENSTHIGYSPYRRFSFGPNCELRGVRAQAGGQALDCATCMTVYPDFFTKENEVARTTTLIHEILHNINDWGDFRHEDETDYPGIGRQSWENPASYAAAIRDLSQQAFNQNDHP